MPITTLMEGLPNQSMSQADFDQATGKYMGELPTWGTEATALQVDVNAKQVAAAASAVTAQAQAFVATTQSNAAVTAVNAIAWSSGTYVASPLADVRYSPSDGRTYRCRANVTGSVDPSVDNAHWVCISAIPRAYMHVRDQKASGVAGGGSSAGPGFTVRTLNTVVGSIGIAGASLSSNQISLPAGVYEIDASAPAMGVNQHKLSLRDVTNSIDLLVGENAYSPSSGVTQTSARVAGQFTLAATTTICLRHFTGVISSSNDFGIAASSGQPEVYASIRIWKES